LLYSYLNVSLVRHYPLNCLRLLFRKKKKIL